MFRDFFCVEKKEQKQKNLQVGLGKRQEKLHLGLGKRISRVKLGSLVKTIEALM